MGIAMADTNILDVLRKAIELAMPDFRHYYRMTRKARVVNAYASDGTKTLAMSTYHNVDDGWYLCLPDSWRDRILITRTAGAEASTVTFSIQGDGTEPPRDFLRITKLTGSNREIQATRAGRIILRRQPEIIYTAELLEANSGWEYGLTEDEVREAFNLITTEWTAGES